MAVLETETNHPNQYAERGEWERSAPDPWDAIGLSLAVREPEGSGNVGRRNVQDTVAEELLTVTHNTHPRDPGSDTCQRDRLTRSHRAAESRGNAREQTG